MDVIEVPAPPKAAFNKHRRISDLIKAQVNHLKHVENKLPASARAGIPQHAIVSENDAAIYIAAMTRLLRGEAAGVAVVEPAEKRRRVVPIRKTAAVIDVAAAAEAGEKEQESNKKGGARRTKEQANGAKPAPSPKGGAAGRGRR